jgi:hypothetical protein
MTLALRRMAGVSRDAPLAPANRPGRVSRASLRRRSRPSLRRRSRPGCGIGLGHQAALVVLPSHRVCLRRHHCPAVDFCSRAGGAPCWRRMRSRVLEAHSGPAGLRLRRPAPRSPRRFTALGFPEDRLAQGRDARASAAGGTRRPGNSSATGRHDLLGGGGVPLSRGWRWIRRLNSRRSAPRGRRSGLAALRGWPRRYRPSVARLSGPAGRR